MVNVTFCQNQAIPDGKLVEVIFGKQSMPEKYILLDVAMGDEIRTGVSFEIQPIFFIDSATNKILCGVSIVFSGLKFFCSWEKSIVDVFYGIEKNKGKSPLGAIKNQPLTMNYENTNVSLVFR